MPVMTEEWLDAVWSASLKGLVKGNDPQFDRYKCPCFKGLTISLSKIKPVHKKRIQELIEANGRLLLFFSANGIIERECLLTRLPHLEGMWSGSVRSSLPVLMPVGSIATPLLKRSWLFTSHCKYRET